MEGDWNGKQVNGWFWTLDLPKLTNSDCTEQRRHSFSDIDNSANGRSANGNSANGNSTNGTSPKSKSANGSYPILIASIASSITLMLTLALVFALLFVRRRYTKRTAIEKVDSNYDYGVYYGAGGERIDEGVVEMVDQNNYYE